MKDAFHLKSRCCNDCWKLMYADGKYMLLCAKCGEPAGPELTVTGPLIEHTDAEGSDPSVVVH